MTSKFLQGGMTDLMNLITTILITFVSIVLSAILCIMSMNFIESLRDSTHCVATINGDEFANTAAWNMACISQGDSTQCTVYSGNRFFRFPIKHLVGKNIVVDCK